MTLFREIKRHPPVRDIETDGSFGGMKIQVSDDDKVAIIGNSEFALQIRHPNGRTVRITWNGTITLGDALVEVKP